MIIIPVEKSNLNHQIIGNNESPVRILKSSKLMNGSPGYFSITHIKVSLPLSHLVFFQLDTLPSILQIGQIQ